MDSSGSVKVNKWLICLKVCVPLSIYSKSGLIEKLLKTVVLDLRVVALWYMMLTGEKPMKHEQCFLCSNISGVRNIGGVQGFPWIGGLVQRCKTLIGQVPGSSIDCQESSLLIGIAFSHSA